MSIPHPPLRARLPAIFLPSHLQGVKALLAASPSSLTAGRLLWGRNGGGGSFVAPVASRPLAANRCGGAGGVANGWSVAAGSGRKEVGGEQRGHSLRMATVRVFGNVRRHPLPAPLTMMLCSVHEVDSDCDP